MRTVVLALFALALVLVAAGPPVVPVTITGDSMEPTVREGQTVLAVPWASADQGDVVTYDLGDGFVTHRVVAETRAGLVTRGDANPTADQAAGAAPVPRGAVLGTVVSWDGEPIAVPGLGWLASIADGNRPALLAGGLLAFALGGFRRTRDVSRPKRARNVVDVGLLTCFLGGLALVVLGVTTRDLSFVATEGPTTAARAVPVGAASVVEVTLDVVAPPLTTTVVDASGVEVLSHAARDGAQALEVRVPARQTPGVVRGTVTVTPYPATLPRGVLEALHGVHPALARVASVSVVFAPLWALSRLALDGRTVLRWPNWRRLRRRGGA